MDRKAQYKHKADDVNTIRNKTRTEDVAIRKEKKEKILSSKRFRTVAAEGITDEITEAEVTEATKNLKKHGPHRKENLKLLRQAFSQGTVYIDAFFSVENALNTLVGLYTGNDAELQIEAAWCITNISAGTHDHAMAITKHVAPYLVTYLSSGVHQLQDQSAWALGNIAGDSPECKKMIQAHGLIPPLAQLLQSPHPAVVQSAAFALSNLVKDSSDIAGEMVEANVITSLMPHFMYTPDNADILAEVSWIFTYLSTSGEFSDMLCSSGVLNQTVSLLVHLSSIQPHIAQIVTPLLRCLGNICSGPDQFSLRACDNPHLLPALSVYLSSDLRHVRKETLWVLSNMTGEVSVCKAITFGPLLSLILKQVPSAFDIKMEALYLLCNIAYHGEEMCCHLVENGVLEAVVPCLKSSDVEILNLSLALCEMCLRMSHDAKERFDRQCEGVARLEALEYHDNESIRQQAINILEVYFETDDEDGEKG